MSANTTSYPDGWICFECCEEDDAQVSEDYRNGQEDWAIIHKEEEAREECPELFGEDEQDAAEGAWERQQMGAGWK